MHFSPLIIRGEKKKHQKNCDQRSPICLQFTLTQIVLINTGAIPVKVARKSSWGSGERSNILILKGFKSWTQQGPEQPDLTVKSALLREG